jgi:Immunoglobulin I-set domain/NHL repeat
MKLKMFFWASAAPALAATILSAQTITIQPTNQTVMAGSMATLSVAVSGTGPFTYQWQFNGSNLPNGIINTVAGNGSGSYSGDGGAATNASLYYPEGAAFDAAGNLFIADFVNNRIRKVTTNGIITTVAGNGSPGYSGDGVPATNATMRPAGVALDTAGNLFIADWNNNRIRKVDTNGIITTVAGNGSSGYSGDGGPATDAKLAYVEDVAVDGSGNLFIADTDNNRIRKVDTNGIITTVAGKGPAVFGSYSGDGGAATNANLNAPYGVAVDVFGNLFIADMDNNRIRKVDTNGIITTVAGNGSADYSGDGGAATNACLDAPYGVSVDVFGNLFFADSWNDRIRKVDAFGTITTVAGKDTWGYSGDGGPATNATLNLPSGVALDSTGNLFLADLGNERIREVVLFASYPTFTLNNVSLDNDGSYSVVITGPGSSVTSSVVTLTVLSPPIIVSQPQSIITSNGVPVSFNVTVVGTAPLSVQWQKNGMNLTDDGNLSGSTTTNLLLNNITTNDAGGYAVIITNVWGSVTSSMANLAVMTPARPSNQTVILGGVATFSVTVAGNGPFTYQWQLNGTNLPNGIITTVAGNGTSGFSGDGGAATNAKLNHPFGVVSDAFGKLFITDSSNHRIRKMGTDGIITTVAGNGSNSYSGDGGPATNASLYLPAGMVWDSSGNLFFADNYNNRIRKVSVNGIITTVAGNGTNNYSGDGGAATNASLYHPANVAMDTLDNLFIADTGNNRIRKVDTNGIIATVAGNGTNGYSGDGGAATNARLSSPIGMAMDPLGNLFIADTGNNCIRKVDTNGLITTVAGNGTSGFSGDGGAATNARLFSPFGMAMDTLGNLFFADLNNNRIRKVSVSGIITTMAGGGSSSPGDGGAATNASLYYPEGVGLDIFGNLFFADSNNNRIRKVALFASYPTLTLNNVYPNNAGNYSVIITGPGGSVTSSIVTLTVTVPPPVISQTVINSNHSVTLQLLTAPYLSSRVLAATNLGSAVWLPIYTNLAGPAGVWQFTDINTAGRPVKFYRISTP